MLAVSIAEDSMHKKRLRKKLGKRYKDKAVRGASAVSALLVAAGVQAAYANAGRIQSTLLPPVVKAAAMARCVFATYEGAAKAFEPVTKARAVAPYTYYRMHHGLPCS